jgi:hypothetical protein
MIIFEIKLFEMILFHVAILLRLEKRTIIAEN